MCSITQCTKCPLYKNQKPLINLQDSCDIMWIGLSAKKIDNVEEGIPLSPLTKSGQILQLIEESFENLSTYKTNLVKCLPLDLEGKLRYPTKFEMNACVPHIETEINWLEPKLVILLGEKVSEAVLGYFGILGQKRLNDYEYSSVIHNGIRYLSIQHPSYIAVYRRNDIPQYALGINIIVSEIF